MKKLINNIGVLIITISFISCEGNTDRSRLLKNESSQAIHVIANGISLPDYDKLISVGQTETLFITNQRGGSDYVEEPPIGITTFVIVNSLGDTCTKDFKIKSNWDLHIEEKTKIPSNWQHEYSFIVDDSDF